MAGKTRHLQQRASGFYARIAVPKALQPVLGKRELSAALHATSRAQAIQKLAAAVAKMLAQVDAARVQAHGVSTPKAPRKGQHNSGSEVRSPRASTNYINT